MVNAALARLRSDETYRMAMGWCADHGVAPSTYWGGPRFAEVDPDEEALRLLPGEWEEGRDAEVILAVLIDRSERCPRCGTREADWLVWNEEAKRWERAWPMHTEEHVCYGCKMLDEDHEAMEKRHPGGKVPAGLRLRLAPGEPDVRPAVEEQAEGALQGGVPPGPVRGKGLAD